VVLFWLSVMVVRYRDRSRPGIVGDNVSAVVVEAAVVVVVGLVFKKLS
jgi:hypothetical protein